MLMRYLANLSLAAGLCLTATSAFAHAHLQSAVPGVGEAVTKSPSEIQITFSENLVVAFSGVSLVKDGGGAVATGKPVLGPSNTLHVRIIHPLAPGTYAVNWHAVSTDTHRTQGTYKFTVAP